MDIKIEVEAQAYPKGKMRFEIINPHDIVGEGRWQYRKCISIG